MATLQPDGPVLEELPRAECLRLLATVPIGRISYTRQALPAVEPVNFALHDGAIVIRTDAGGKLAAATRRAVVAFQADNLDLVRRSGWSVTVVGRCQEVADAADLAALEDLGLESWVPGTRNHYIRIEPGIVTGRRLRESALLGPIARSLGRRSLADGTIGPGVRDSGPMAWKAAGRTRSEDAEWNGSDRRHGPDPTAQSGSARSRISPSRRIFTHMRTSRERQVR